MATLRQSIMIRQVLKVSLSPQRVVPSRSFTVSSHLHKDSDAKSGNMDHMMKNQRLQGEPVHNFTPTYSRDVMSQIQDARSGVKPNDVNKHPATTAPETVSPESYEHSSHVSLYSCMQSNVPHPYNKGPTYLNMPSGGHSHQQKYISSMRNDTHPSRNFSTGSVTCADQQEVSGAKKSDKSGSEGRELSGSGEQERFDDSQGGDDQGKTGPDKNLSQAARLKLAVKDYGGTVVVFHVAISLASLGGFYVAVSSGIDMVGILKSLGIGQSILESKIVAGASTFVVAYAVHKVFAPVRIAITLTCTPFIVRHLRRIGVLKSPSTQSLK